MVADPSSGQRSIRSIVKRILLTRGIFYTVELRGKLPNYATGKDVIITLCGLFNKDEVLNHAVVSLLRLDS